MASTAPSTASPAPPARNSKVRLLGLPILVLVGVEIYLGNALAIAGSPYPSNLLDAHIGAAALLILFSAAAVAVAWRLPRRLLRAASAVTFLAAVGATASGSIFLWHGQANAALDGMEGCAGIVLLGALILLIWGSVAVPAPSSPAT